MFLPLPLVSAAAAQEFHRDAAAIGDQVLQLTALHGGHLALRTPGGFSKHGYNVIFYGNHQMYV